MPSDAARPAGPLVTACIAGSLALGALGWGAWRALPTACFRLGVIAHQHDVHQPARLLLSHFAHTWPEDERAVVALNLVFDDYVSTGDWPGLALQWREFDADPRLEPALQTDDAPR